MQIRTERLLLRRWRPSDREAFAALNADPVVMEHFVAPLARVDSDAFADRIEGDFAARDVGPWAVELPGEADFIGFVGLLYQDFAAPFTPCFEIGWRLARSAWGSGYATEAARAACADGFGRLGLDDVVSTTAPANVRSIAVMRRLGMVFEREFDHPRVPVGHPLRRHVLYRLRPTLRT